MSEGTAANAPARLFDPGLRRVATVVVLGSVMSILDTTIVNVALANLVRDLHSSVRTIQWVSSGYLISIALFVPLTAWAAHRFGAKRSWLVAVGLFTLCSALCGMSWSAGSLVVFRLLQGAGGGMIMPLGQTLLTREAGSQRLARVMTFLMIPTLLAPMAGPVLGGVILAGLSWRWIFYVNVPIGILALLLGRRSLPTEASNTVVRVNVVELLLISPGLALAVYALSQVGSANLLMQMVLPLLLGIGLILAFGLHAWKSEQPLVNIRLWRSGMFATANTMQFFISATITSGMFIIPLYYQLGRGMSPLRSALLLAPGAAGAMTAGQLSTRFVRLAGLKTVTFVGMSMMLAGMLVYTRVTPTTNVGLLAVAWFVRGAGNGMCLPQIQAAGYISLPRDQLAGATTLNNIGQRVGGAVGVALAAALLQVAGHGPASRSAHVLAQAYRVSFWASVSFAIIALLPAVRLPGRTKELDAVVIDPELAID